MNVQRTAVLSFISGVVTGLWAVRTLFGGPKKTKIKVWRHNGGPFKAKTKDQVIRLERLQGIQWHINNTDLPDSATIELRFFLDGKEVDGPLTEPRPNDKRSARRDRWVLSTVRSDAIPEKYCYCVYLIDGSTELLLEDPELIIEGDLRHKG